MDNVLDTQLCKQQVRMATWTSWSCCLNTTWTWNLRLGSIRFTTSFTGVCMILVIVSPLTSTHCYSGQGWGPRRAPRSIWGWGLCHRGAAEGWSRFERQKQAEADTITHSCQQGPLAGGQDSAGLWLPPQPAGICLSLTKEICAAQT